MKNKKTTIIISIICFVLIIAAFLCVGGLLARQVYRAVARMYTDMSRYEINNFSKYQDSFEVIAKSVMQLTDKTLQASVQGSYAAVNGISSSGYWQIKYYDDSHKFIESVELIASEEEINAYQKVQEAFLTNGTEHGLLTIKVLPDRVIFIACVPYYVIYMENGKRPDYLVVDTEDKNSIHIEKLDKNWYHGTRRKLEMLYE